MAKDNFPYIQSTLLTHERITFQTRRHWIIFWPAAFWAVATIVLSLYYPFELAEPMPIINGLSVREIIIYLAFFMIIYSAVSAYINYISSEFGITNKRVLMKVGFIRRFSLEIFLERIESINVRQGVVGRILGFGTISVIGTGGTRDYFRYIPDPLDFRQRVQRQINILEEENLGRARTKFEEK